MNKILLFTSFVLCGVLHVFGQPKMDVKKTVDSIHVLIKLANSEKLNSNFGSALRYSTKAVELARVSDLKLEKAQAYNGLAGTYNILNDDDNSKKYFLLALQLGQELEDNITISAALNGLGDLYSKKAETLDVAIEYYEKSFDYAKVSKNPNHICGWYLSMANLYLNFKNADKALLFIELAQKHLTENNLEYPMYWATYYHHKGLYHFQKKQYRAALESLNKGISIGQENNLHIELIDLYELKSKIYEARGQYVLANKNLKKLQEYKNMNFNAEKNVQIEEVNTRFKISEYERDLAEAKYEKKILDSRNEIITIVLIAFVLFAFLIGYIIHTVKDRQRERDSLAERTKIEHLTKLKSEFLTTISHELRTPLYGVMGITSILSDDKTLTVEHKNLIKSLQFSGNRLHELVNKILRITDIESDRVAVNKNIVNLKGLVKDIVQSLEYSANEKNNKLIINLDPSVDILYYIDSLKISEILNNLITNAIKFTNNGRIVIQIKRLQAAEGNNYLSFKVIDNGIGIARENHELIFQNFKQAIEENTSYGSGVGLSIVKNYVETLGGKIELESELEKGSTFSFDLYCEIATPSIIAQHSNHVKSRPLKVLVVEDNKINQMITNKLIVSIGHSCTISHNGMEAVELCKSDNFDLILMDINMPIMNGFEASKTIKSFKPEANIVALTALEISEVKDQCFSVGMVGIVNKPIGKSELNDIIQMNVAS
ncbi:ATP-binding protein [Algibacter miyuki]|uniref:histidine kinase n=1 Tax=Algibacter miyuki TaxID=1306933 RepID=A0ABV5GZC4_9FLAO|nr:ATP-binding protein [Algibacter miyuki]MDN3667225.1 ATP-binding protein [Algibacter miyuki]